MNSIRWRSPWDDEPARSRLPGGPILLSLLVIAWSEVGSFDPKTLFAWTEREPQAPSASAYRIQPLARRLIEARLSIPGFLNTSPAAASETRASRSPIRAASSPAVTAAPSIDVIPAGSAPRTGVAGRDQTWVPDPDSSLVRGPNETREFLAHFAPRPEPARRTAWSRPVACTSIDGAAGPVRGSDGRVTSGFSPARRHPIWGHIEAHNGLDIAAARGAPVTPVRSGVVSAAGPATGYGLRVIVDHADGLQSLYAHLLSAGVRVGDLVSPADTIGRVGESGYATGAHLHFELSRYGLPFNPCEFPAF